MIKKSDNLYYFYYCVLFIIFFVFFSQVHPLLPFDTDDWKYVGFTRPPYPTLSTWNPTKILPECLQALTGLIAAYFVTPIINDYLTALIYSHAFVISIFIIGYFFSIQKLLVWKYRINSLSGYCIITILVLLHFIVLKTRPTNNDHLFYSSDVNCYYNYIVPNMLCASLAMYLMRHEIKVSMCISKFSIILFLTFLALFSNLYSTIILIAYIGAKLLLDLYKYDKRQSNWLNSYIKKNIFSLLVIAIWLIVQFLEAKGSRANAYGSMLLPFNESLTTAVKLFISTHYNKWFLFFSIAIILCAKTYSFFNEKHQLFHIGKTSQIIFLALLFSIVYLIILSSQVYPQYLLRSEVMFSYFFYYFLLVALCLGYLTSKLNYIKILYPFFIFFFFFLLNSSDNTFVDVQYPYGTELKTCEAIDRDIINQVKTAELLGKDTVTIYVHSYNENSNWPLILHQGKYFGMTLYKHGIIHHKITTIFERMPKEIDKQK